MNLLPRLIPREILPGSERYLIAHPPSSRHAFTIGVQISLFSLTFDLGFQVWAVFITSGTRDPPLPSFPRGQQLLPV